MFIRSLLILSLAIVCAPAFAADYYPYTPPPVIDPPPPPPPPPPASPWNGCYIGLEAGVGASTTTHKLTPNDIFFGQYITQGNSADGYPVLSGSLGCDISSGNFLGGIMVGVTTPHQGSDISKTQTDPVSYNLTMHENTSFELSLRAGYVTNNLLVFGKVGAVYRDTSYATDVNETSYLTTDLAQATAGTSTKNYYRPLWNIQFDASAESKRILPILGFGAEYAFAPNWTMKIEVDGMFDPSRNADFVVNSIAATNNRNSNPPTCSVGGTTTGTSCSGGISGYGNYLGYDTPTGRDPVIGDIVKHVVSSTDVNLKIGLTRRF